MGMKEWRTETKDSNRPPLIVFQNKSTQDDEWIASDSWIWNLQMVGDTLSSLAWLASRNSRDWPGMMALLWNG